MVLPPKFLREFLQVRFHVPNLTPCLRFEVFVSQSPGCGVAGKKKKKREGRAEDAELLPTADLSRARRKPQQLTEQPLPLQRAF